MSFYGSIYANTAAIYDNTEAMKVNKDSIANNADAIKDEAGEIRKILGSVMHIRYIPVLRFLEDSALEYGNKIDKILSTITYGENNDDN